MAAKGNPIKKSGKEGNTILFYLLFAFLYLILPLVYFPSAQDASLVPRLLLLILFLLCFTIFLYFYKRNSSICFTHLRNPVVLFGGLYFIVSILSLSGAITTNEGFFDIIKTGVTILIVIFAVQQMLNNPEWFSSLSRLLVVALIIACIIGIYQYLVLLDKFPEGRMLNRQRLIYGVTGLMGNKNEYASSLLLMLPFSVYSVISGRGIWRVLASLATLFAGCMLLFLATRATWLGLFAEGSVCVAVLLIYRQKLNVGSKTVRTVVVISTIVLSIIVVGAIDGGRFTKLTIFEQLGSIFRPDAGNNHFRLNVWKITLEMTMNHPLSGVGAGNWQIAIPEYYREIGLQGKEVNWISPHNDYFWILSEKGIPGLIFYLGVIFLAVWWFFRVLRSQAPGSTLLKALLLFSGLVGYLVVACFDFPYQRIDHQVMFATYLAGLLVLYLGIYPSKSQEVNRHLFFIPVIVFLVFGLYYSAQSLNLESHVKRGEQLEKEGKLTQALEELRQARTYFRSIDAKGSPVEYYMGMILDKTGNNQAALASYLEGLAMHPNHLALLNNIGKCYYQSGKYRLAEYYYLKALNIVPGYKETRVNLSTLYYKQNEYKKSLDMLSGIKGAQRIPEIRQNINALNKILGISTDTLSKEKKRQEKALRKAEKKRKGLKHH